MFVIHGHSEESSELRLLTCKRLGFELNPWILAPTLYILLLFFHRGYSSLAAGSKTTNLNGERLKSKLTVLDNLHQAAKVGQDGTAHEDGDLLHDLDARVPGLPGLLALTHGFEEGQEGGDAEGRGHHSEGSSRGVSHVLVHVVDIRSHGGDHRSQASSL